MTSYKIDQHLSLMIPRVFPQWTSEQHIIDVFHKQDIGKVFKVDIIRTPDEPGRHYPIYQAFIYFSVWYENDIAFHFQERIFNSVNKQTRVVYDDPWFWVVFENKSKKNALSRDDIRLMKMDRKLYEAEQRLNEQGQCIQQLQECVLLTTTAMNDAAEATVASVATDPPMDKRQPYPEDDYIQWAEPKGAWDKCDDEIDGCDACDVMTCCDHMKRVEPATHSHMDETHPYPARPRSNWFECEIGTKHDNAFSNCKIYGCKTCCNACDMSACSKHVN